MEEEGFKYWLTDHEDMRSPFPKHMHEELRSQTTQRFSEWIHTVGKEGMSQLKETEIVEMFEMFLFNVGLSLTSDPDQQITITYPLMPRCGDEVDDINNGLSSVTHRKIIEKDGEKRQLQLVLKTQAGGKSWQTEFELPA